MYHPFFFNGFELFYFKIRLLYKRWLYWNLKTSLTKAISFRFYSTVYKVNFRYVAWKGGGDGVLGARLTPTFVRFSPQNREMLQMIICSLQTDAKKCDLKKSAFLSRKIRNILLMRIVKLCDSVCVPVKWRYITMRSY